MNSSIRISLAQCCRSFLCLFAAVMGIALLSGCQENQAGKSGGQSGSGAAPEGEHAHEHGEKGPHGGQLIELGKGDYHAELVHDDAAQRITIYVLDEKAAKPVPIKQKEL